MSDDGLNPKREKCVHCGEVARGYAYIDDKRYCHPDDGPSCYEEAQAFDTEGFAIWLADMARLGKEK